MDMAVIEFFHRLDPGSAPVRLMVLASGLLNPLKFGPPALALILTWFAARDRAQHGVLADPERLLRNALGVVAALAACQVVQGLLPMRPRPRFVYPELFPARLDMSVMWDWSSMPSDHAALAAALVVAIWPRSRRLAIFCAAWAATICCAPRVYFGLHYLSDTLVGAVLGATVMGFFLRVPLPAKAWGWLCRLELRRPEFVILGVYVLGWEIMEMFDTPRRLAGAVVKVARIFAPETI
jgi:undecaprenyl-diphosphatase